MTAITKAWVTIADGAVDADSPLDQALMTGLRDNAEHLRQWLGAAYYAGAVQNHNHDGLNSALISIGPNMLRNAGFEEGLTGWGTSTYSGGSVAINTGNDMEGQQALAITSSVVANGGGYALSSPVAVGGGLAYRFAVLVRAAGANVSSQAVVRWYNKAGSLISSTTVFSVASTGTVAGAFERVVVAPALARSAALEVTGGVPGLGSSAGTVYFDAAFMGSGWDRFMAAGDYLLHANDVSNGNGTAPYVKTHEIVSAYCGVLRVRFDLNCNTADSVNGRVYINGVAVGTERTRSGSGTSTFTEDIGGINAGDLIQIYARQASGTPVATVSNFRLLGSLPVAFSTTLP